MTNRPHAAWRAWDLAYCSNVHPASTLADVLDLVSGSISRVRQQLFLSAMGCGLWLPAGAAAGLGTDPDALEGFRARLDEAGLRLFTLNGFPFGGFHDERVKERVYRPDWAEPERLAYTRDLARVLAHCLPPDSAEGSISTLPLGFAPDWNRDRHDRALEALCRLTDDLAALREETGRSIRVCLEMEPGCVLETTDQAIAFFRDDLAAAAARHGIPAAQIGHHLGICFDICHQAVMFESPADALDRFRQAGIAVGKIQVSSALELTHPSRSSPQKLLAPYAEPRYLHQVRTPGEGNGLVGTMDLAEALEPNALPLLNPWRIHFHVPVQTGQLENAGLATTQAAIAETLDYLRLHPALHPHLEVETYTWQVLPHSLRPVSEAELIEGLAGEIEWLLSEMLRRGLLKDPGS